MPIPGNDDAARAIQLYCELVADAVLDGMTEAQQKMGADIGEAENPIEMALASETPVLEVGELGSSEVNSSPETTKVDETIETVSTESAPETISDKTEDKNK